MGSLRSLRNKGPRVIKVKVSNISQETIDFLTEIKKIIDEYYDEAFLAKTTNMETVTTIGKILSYKE